MPWSPWSEPHKNSVPQKTVTSTQPESSNFKLRTPSFFGDRSNPSHGHFLDVEWISRWWFQACFMFTPTWQNLTNIFVKPPTRSYFQTYLGCFYGSSGQALVDLLNYAKENEFAIPGVNVVSSSSVNACMEAAKKAGGPVMVTFSRGGGQFLGTEVTGF